MAAARARRAALHGARRPVWLAQRRGAVADYVARHEVRKLQLGAGPEQLPGWLNTDLDPTGSNVFLDVTRHFPLADCTFDYVFSEHQIEHLTHDQGRHMLRESFRVLRPGGTIRVATPDLQRLLTLLQDRDDPTAQHYVAAMVQLFVPEADAPRPAYAVNNVLYGHGHRFLYDEETLRAGLEAAGFTEVTRHAAGESDDPVLAGVESHGGGELNRFDTLVLEARRPTASVAGGDCAAPSTLGRTLARNLFLLVPEPWQRRLRTLPLARSIAHRFTHAYSPVGARTWLTIKSGPAAGLRVRIDPRFERFIWAGEGEPALLGPRLLELLEPGAVFYDIGAHIGVYTLIASRRLAGTGCVFSFEPDPANVERLREHVAVNGFEDTVKVVPMPVWSEPANVQFAQDEVYPMRDRGRLTGEPGPVAATAVDAWAETHPPPDVIKIDVEGAEESVLSGAARVLAEHRPVVICEVHTYVTGDPDRLGRVLVMLDEAGYDAEPLNPQMDPTQVIAHPR